VDAVQVPIVLGEKWAVGGFVLETTFRQEPDLTGHIGWQRLPIYGPPQHGGEDLQNRRAGKSAPSAEHLEQPAPNAQASVGVPTGPPTACSGDR
jgi:hypothetical protein